MKPDDLKQAIYAIKVPDKLESRLLRSYRDKPASRFNYRKSVGIAMACMLVISMLIGIPYLTKDPASGNLELVIIDSPLVVQTLAATADNELIAENLTTGTEILLGWYSAALNCVPGFPFFFSYPEQSIELTVNNGQFLLWDVDITVADGYLGTGGKTRRSGIVEQIGNAHTIDGEGYIFWVPFQADDAFQKPLPDAAVIEYRIYEGTNITGYGIIEIYLKDAQAGSYAARLLLSNGFPKVNGKYQNVTEADLADLKDQVVFSTNNDSFTV